MKVVITSATEKEISLLQQNLQNNYTSKTIDLSFHISGVGILCSCFSIANLIIKQKPDLIIQAGIAGTFDNNEPLGKVVVVENEILADTGVQENGVFKDLFDLNLQQENQFPFKQRKLANPFLSKLNYLQWQTITAVTVNEITTDQNRIKDVKAKYNPQIESMEGASLHYCCLQNNVEFIQIRCTSNVVGERDKTKWNFKDSLFNLSNSIATYVDHLNTNTIKL